MTDIITAKCLGVGSVALAGTSAYLAMTDTVKVSIITSGAAVLMAGVSAFFAYRANVFAQKTHKTAEATHQIVNSRMDEFMAMAKKFYFGEGARQEKADEEARRKESKRIPGIKMSAKLKTPNQ